MIEEQQVREAIHKLIARKEARITQVETENKGALDAKKRMVNEAFIASLEHSVNTLIELEHNLRLCGCPDEAYIKADVK